MSTEPNNSSAWAMAAAKETTTFSDMHSWTETEKLADILEEAQVIERHAEPEFAKLREEIAELRKAKERLATIRQLMGYTHEGSIQTVTLSQDDATGDYFIKAGDFWAIDKSFTALLDSAQKKSQP